MKKLYLVFVCAMTFYFPVKAQQFSFKLFFEDSLHHRDTLELGYDINATYGIDTQFNEQDIFTVPFDNDTFVVRIADANPWDGFITPTFYTKKQIIPNTCLLPPSKWIQLAIKCDAFPIIVRWDSSLFQNSCRTKSMISDWIPTDVGPPHQPEEMYMAQNDSIKLNYSQLWNQSPDGIINFFFLSIGDELPGIVNVSDLIRAPLILTSPNPFKNDLSIALKGENIHEATFTITNALGQVIYKREETNLSSNYTKVLDLSYLPSGFYFITVTQNGEVFTRKVVKE